MVQGENICSETALGFEGCSDTARTGKVQMYPEFSAWLHEMELVLRRELFSWKSKNVSLSGKEI